MLYDDLLLALRVKNGLEGNELGLNNHQAQLCEKPRLVTVKFVFYIFWCICNQIYWCFMFCVFRISKNGLKAFTKIILYVFSSRPS